MEIKIRAWDTSSYKMVSPDQIIGLEGEVSKTIPDYLIPLLYTGLKDKNGTEIYEGDILKKTYGSSVPIFEVGYDNSRAMFIQLDGYNEPLFDILPWVEVIGNIYENKELLTP